VLATHGQRRGRHFGLPIGRAAVRPKPVSASRAVGPPSGYDPPGPPARRPAPGRTTSRQLSWSFWPLRRLSLSESTCPRFASPGTFRPQSFSPSRRLAPRPDVRPSFRSVTPLGFWLSRVFPPLPGPTGLSPGGITLLAFFPLCAQPRTLGSRRLPSNRPFAAFRVFLRQRIRTAASPVKAGLQPIPS